LELEPQFRPEITMDISGWNWGSRDISKKRELTATEKP
jgi:hypothetical protein